eukprot:2835254-Amphidinium_carterae.4
MNIRDPSKLMFQHNHSDLNAVLVESNSIFRIPVAPYFNEHLSREPLQAVGLFAVNDAKTADTVEPGSSDRVPAIMDVTPCKSAVGLAIGDRSSPSDSTSSTVATASRVSATPTDVEPQGVVPRPDLVGRDVDEISEASSDCVVDESEL